jgi:egghead protein (zeste-white 4 protein)
VLNDEDWVVHLDEESQLTRRAVIGILDFALRNKHSIGQGLIVHGKGEPKPLNVLSTLADTYRVAGYVGSSRFCLSALHRPLNIFNGSFVVCQKRTEQMVSFDHGMESSITEDAYFAMRASNLGLTFDWIEGELLEKSAFTFWDFVRQRKRWIQGLSLVHNSTRFVPDLSCICFKFNYYVWITSPIQLVAFYALWLLPVSFAECWPSVEWMCWVNGMSVSYLFLLGMTYSFDMDKLSWWEKVCYVGGLWLAFRYWMWAEAIAILWAFLGSKDEFYVIKK